MDKPGTENNPLRVAVIGSGPTGFFTADHLLKNKEISVKVDVFDRLPTPYGLVRGGVAPDHLKIKKVTVGYARTAAKPGFRFLGNVEFGKHVSLDELKQHYHQIVFCTGAQTDRKLGIPGEDLENSRTATEFVAWYNGHPDYRDLSFNLEAKRVVIVGVGNVAVDVARILCRTEEELQESDIADHALEALANSKVEEVVMLGRRGPAQAAFTNPEVKELGEMAGADFIVSEEDATPDALSLQQLEANPDKATTKKLDLLKEFAGQPADGKPKRLVLKFLRSPVELLGDNKLEAVKIVRNELVMKGDRMRPQATEDFEELPAQLLFRSVGYRGVPLPGVPFREDWGTIPNEAGRILDGDQPVEGQYVAGWIKRGPSGVIGTNKPCAKETVTCMLEDLESGKHLNPEAGDEEAILKLLGERTRVVSFKDWEHLDKLEIERGEAAGRPRRKFTRIEDMLEALHSCV